MRQYANSSSIAPSTASVTHAGNNTETDTHRNVRLAFGDMQENPNFMLRPNVYSLSHNYEKYLLDSSYLYACLFVRMEQLDSHWTDFCEIWYSSIFWNSVEKIQISLKSVKSVKRLIYMKNLCPFVLVSRWILLRFRNCSDKSCRENQIIHVIFSNV
jgi:hypothetical protein